jgi:hypothetical protein
VAEVAAVGDPAAGGLAVEIDSWMTQARQL